MMLNKLNIIITTLVLCSTLTACSNQPSSNISKYEMSTLLDYQLQNSDSKQIMSVANVAQELQGTNVVFIGEYHSHSASHLLQMQLLKALHEIDPALILSMEQFTRDKQTLLQQYLNNEIGEQTLIKQGDAWDNYQSDYRPLVEFAREQQLPVIAANTPINLVRCVAKQGPEVINKLSKEKQNWIATDITSSSSQYQQKFMQAMGGHSSHHHKKAKHEAASSAPVKLSNSFYAQLARDNTMAESIYKALKKSPNSLVVHTNGAFHSDSHLGTVDALKRLDPSLKIKVISPQFINQPMDWNKGDYVYTIKPMPTRYIKKENMDKAIRAMMAKRKGSKCELN